MKKNEKIKLTKQEQKIEKALERGDYISAPKLKQTEKIFKEAVKNYQHLQKSKRITIRINQEDLIKVKARAQRNRIPYQTLLNALIHQYAKGQARIEI